MATGIESIDKLLLDQAFGDNINGCWTIRTDSKLLVIDDDETKVSRFSDDELDEERAISGSHFVLTERYQTTCLDSIISMNNNPLVSILGPIVSVLSVLSV